MYHYHQTSRFPYTVGCFRRKPAKLTATPLAGAGGKQVFTDPALYPAFDPGVSDYVVRCTGTPVGVTVDVGPEASASVDGGQPASGHFSTTLALSQGQAFSFELIENGVGRSYHVRCLPGDFPNWSFEALSTPEQAYYGVSPWLGTASPKEYAIFFDRHGVPIWWYKAGTLPIDVRVLNDGSIAWSRYYGGGFGADSRLRYEVHGLDGALLREIFAVGTPVDHHDLVELPNGNVLLLTYVPRDGVNLSPYGGPASATVVDSEIQEVDPTGNLVWSWNSKDHIALDETGRLWAAVIATPTMLPDGRSAYDATHVNSVEVDGDSVVASFRNVDGVYKIDRTTEAIEWKLGGTTTPDSLTVSGDPQGSYPLGGQHDARVLPDGTLSIHDNATALGRPPRAVRYQLDEIGGTATLLESIVDPEAPASGCCGSARRSPAGGWLIGWGQNSLVTEFNSAGNRTFRLHFGGPFSYRAFPVPDGRLSAEALRHGMSAMFPR